MRWRLSPKSKWWAGRIAAAFAIPRAIIAFLDWVVGKVGYLGLFTSPEDYHTMMDRAPLWLQAVWDAVAPGTMFILGRIGAAWDFFVSPVGTALALLLIAIVLVVDMNQITRLTRDWWFNVRHAVAEKVWISRASALDLIKESEWGQLITPFEATIFGSNALAALQHRKSGLSESEKVHLKFRVFLDRCLRAFAENNYDAHRVNDSGYDEYDEVALRAYLDKALDSVIEEEFGKPPTHQVS